MAFINCSACGRQISVEAEACPQCGHPNRTGMEVYCIKPWSGLGAAPKCTITEMSSGDSRKHPLAWELPVFVALKPSSQYRIRIRRPSDPISFKATFDFSITANEVKRLVYRSPALSFMAGTIEAQEK